MRQAQRCVQVCFDQIIQAMSMRVREPRKVDNRGTSAKMLDKFRRGRSSPPLTAKDGVKLVTRHRDHGNSTIRERCAHMPADKATPARYCDLDQGRTPSPKPLPVNVCHRIRMSRANDSRDT